MKNEESNRIFLTLTKKLEETNNLNGVDKDE